jgi:hypothetical protein
VNGEEAEAGSPLVEMPVEIEDDAGTDTKCVNCWLGQRRRFLPIRQLGSNRSAGGGALSRNRNAAPRSTVGSPLTFVDALASRCRYAPHCRSGRIKASLKSFRTSKRSSSA